MKKTIESLIKAERALEAALVYSVRDEDQARKEGDVCQLDFIRRQRVAIDRLQIQLRRIKDSLTTVAARDYPIERWAAKRRIPIRTSDEWAWK